MTATNGASGGPRPALLIDGEWTTGSGVRTVVDPADERAIATVGYGDRHHATAAADAAAAAFPSWAARSPRARADVLLGAASLLVARADAIGETLARETGKLRAEAVGEVRFAAEYFRWFAEEVRRPAGDVMPAEVAGRRHVTLAQPAGVAVCLTPWNFPVSIQARKLAAALAAGCTVVSRPSDRAPLAVIELFRCLAEAGVPRGAANLVLGPAGEVTEALLAHPAVRVASFTGSTEVGRDLMRLAAARMVRPLLELGGRAPFIVFADADLDRALEGAMLAKFRNNGQSCIAADRFYVQATVYGTFVRRLADRVAAMRLGGPLHAPPPSLGPVIDAERRDTLETALAEALGLGARLAGGRPPVPARGTFVAPAVVLDVSPQARLARTEVFGPIAVVHRFDDEDEAVAAANATELGLAAYVYTGDVDRAWRIAERLEAGIVGVNEALPSVAFAPMGGVKQSGLGREGSREGLEEFQERKYVAFGAAAPARAPAPARATAG